MAWVTAMELVVSFPMAMLSKAIPWGRQQQKGLRWASRHGLARAHQLRAAVDLAALYVSHTVYRGAQGHGLSGASGAI